MKSLSNSPTAAWENRRAKLTFDGGGTRRRSRRASRGPSRPDCATPRHVCTAPVADERVILAFSRRAAPRSFVECLRLIEASAARQTRRRMKCLLAAPRRTCRQQSGLQAALWSTKGEVLLNYAPFTGMSETQLPTHCHT